MALLKRGRRVGMDAAMMPTFSSSTTQIARSTRPHVTEPSPLLRTMFFKSTVLMIVQIPVLSWSAGCRALRGEGYLQVSHTHQDKNATLKSHVHLHIPQNNDG